METVRANIEPTLYGCVAFIDLRRRSGGGPVHSDGIPRTCVFIVPLTRETFDQSGHSTRDGGGRFRGQSEENTVRIDTNTLEQLYGYKTPAFRRENILQKKTSHIL